MDSTKSWQLAFLRETLKILSAQCEKRLCRRGVSVSNGVIVDIDDISIVYAMGGTQVSVLLGVTLQVQQRVAFARVLAEPPRTPSSVVVLADEPTGNLDTHAGESIMKILISLTRGESGILSMVTHNPDVREKMDKVYNMREGKILNIL
jgi:ABC-type sugar transport system ATPase subunit